MKTYIFLDVVLFIILGICSYTLLYPILIELPFETNPLSKLQTSDLFEKLTEPEFECIKNMLYIPNARIRGEIITSTNSATIDKGFWHLSESATPETSGNMVVSGHRFLYLPPLENTLFNLDLVNIGDKITICWEKVPYNYIVKKILTVEPTELSIQTQTAEPTLTIYTCTPKWTNEKRLVIIAKLL